MRTDNGHRLLTELELWEVSLVTFPMLPAARVSAKAGPEPDATLRDLTALFETGRAMLTRDRPTGD